MCRELVVCGRYVNATLKYGHDDAFEYTNSLDILHVICTNTVSPLSSR